MPISQSLQSCQSRSRTGHSRALYSGVERSRHDNQHDNQDCPDSGLDFPVQVLKPFKLVSSPLDSGDGNIVEDRRARNLEQEAIAAERSLVSESQGE